MGFSKLSDIYGRKRILAVAWLLFTLGSVGCGIARRMGELYVSPFSSPRLLLALYGLLLTEMWQHCRPGSSGHGRVGVVQPGAGVSS